MGGVDGVDGGDGGDGVDGGVMDGSAGTPSVRTIERTTMRLHLCSPET